MPRYFFHVKDGIEIPDHEGTELPDLEAVRAMAVKASAEALWDLGAQFWESEQWEMRVVDEQGDVLVTLMFSGQCQRDEAPAL